MSGCIPQVKLLYPDLTRRDISVSAIFGYYSRSNDTTEKLVDKAWEQTAESKGTRRVFEDFIEKWIIGYKHNSLSEHPSLHFYVENISNIATKILEANSMGQNGVPVAYMEKSTRYVNMENAKVFNVLTKYLNNLDESYSEVSDYKKRFDEIVDKEMRMYEKRLRLYEDICEKNEVPKSKAFDSARHYLPSGISSIVGVSLNVRAAKEVIINLISNGNSEAYMIGQQLLDVCCLHFGSIFRRDEILERVTYRANLLRYALTEAEKEESNARVVVRHINPNYGFLKSIKTSEIIPFEKIKERVLFEENRGEPYRIKNNCVVNLKTFFDVYTHIAGLSGEIGTSKRILNYIYEYHKNTGINGKINTNDIPDDAYDNSMEIKVEADYGSYRDIARHRRIKFIGRNFYSHSLVEKMYENNTDSYIGFFNYYLEGIITDIPESDDSPLTSSNKIALTYETRKYYTELTIEILDLLIDIKNFLQKINYDTIESNVLLLEILSYLVPMSIEKMYRFRGSIPDVLHLVQERLQPAGHLYYRSVASSIWDNMCKYYKYQKDDEFTNFVNHELSVKKDKQGSIWKDVGLSIDDKIMI